MHRSSVQSRCALTLGVLISVLAPLTTASASVTYISASRNVRASLQIPSMLQQFPSTALGPYMQSASVIGQDPFGANEFSTAGASQTSNTLTDRITYLASASASDGISASSGSGAGTGTSSLVVRFSVDTPTPYALVGPNATYSGNSDASASERLVLIDNNTTIFNQNLFSGPLVNFSGILAVGTYEFTVQIDALSRGIGTSFSNLSVNRQLAIPAPGTAAAIVAAGLLAPRRRRSAGK